MGAYRILHIIRDLEMSGGQVLLLRNVIHMKSPQFQHLVCYVRPNSELESAFLKAGIRTVCLNHREGRGILTLLRLIGLVRRERIDLIHANNGRIDRFYGQLAALLAEFLWSIPFISCQ